MKSCLRTLLIAFAMCPCATFAAVPTQNYVDTKTETKVDTSKTAQQDMAGKYTVSGSFEVPTPELPEVT